MMHTTIEDIASAPRGSVLQAAIASETLASELPDYGVDCAVLTADEIASMGDAYFVERLNDIRLSDQLLIVRGLIESQNAKAMALFNIEHVLTKLGGRAVLVAA
jgi:hypothetical protein